MKSDLVEFLNKLASANNVSPEFILGEITKKGDDHEKVLKMLRKKAKQQAKKVSK